MQPQSTTGTVKLEKEDQPPSAPAAEIWDEEGLEKAMKTLKEMHIQASFPRNVLRSSLTHVQLRNLRSTIPRLMAPLSTKQPSRRFEPCNDMQQF